jgi:hypothetical protein
MSPGIGFVGAAAVGACGGVIVIVVGTAFGAWLHATVGETVLSRPDLQQGVLWYITTNEVNLIAATASFVALAVWLRARAVPLTLAGTGALTTVFVGALASPVLVLVARCGPADAISCPANFIFIYTTLYGLVTVRALTKAALLSALVLTIAAGLRSIRRLRGRDHDVAATHTPRRPTIRSWSGAALTAALTIAFIVLAAAAVYFDLVTR